MGVIGSITTRKKIASAKLNGRLGGRPIKKNPVRLRRHHKGHPEYPIYVAEQAAKAKKAAQE